MAAKDCPLTLAIFVRPMLACAKAPSFINKRKNMKQPNLLMQEKRFDEARPGIPGEHVFALSMGLAAWWLTRRHASFIARSIGLGVGGVPIGRSASGRDGISKKLPACLPLGGQCRVRIKSLRPQTTFDLSAEQLRFK